MKTRHIPWYVAEARNPVPVETPPPCTKSDSMTRTYDSVPERQWNSISDSLLSVPHIESNRSIP